MNTNTSSIFYIIIIVGTIFLYQNVKPKINYEHKHTQTENDKENTKKISKKNVQTQVQIDIGDFIVVDYCPSK